MAADHDRQVAAPDAEELELTRLVFGDTEGFHANLAKIDSLYTDGDDIDGYSSASTELSDDDDDDEPLQDDDLFVIDDEAAEGVDAMDVDSDATSSDSDDAWADSDDERVTVHLTQLAKLKKLRKYDDDNVIGGRSYLHRLRSQFERIYPRPQWVEEWETHADNVNSLDEDNDDDGKPKSRDLAAVLQLLVLYLTKTKPKLMLANHLAIVRLKDANAQRRSKGSIQAVDFHPTHPLLLTAGFDKTIRVYHIDGEHNPFITSVFFRDSTLTLCQFSPRGDDTMIYAGGRRKYMNRWDVTLGEVEKILRLYGHEANQETMEYFKLLPKGSFIGLKGDNGWVNLLNPLGQWARGMKIEGKVSDLAFAHDELRVLIASTAGDMWEFALNQAAGAKGVNINQPVRKWHDDGVNVTCIAYGGPRDRWLAVGTQLGIVNIYDRAKLEAAIDAGTTTPKPLKAVGNIVYPILTLEFSPDGQMLVIASRGKRDLLRIVHLPLARVFPNWPTLGTPLGKVTAVKFAPDNSMLAIANEQARVTLWRLTHY